MILILVRDEQFITDMINFSMKKKRLKSLLNQEDKVAEKEKIFNRKSHLEDLLRGKVLMKKK